MARWARLTVPPLSGTGVFGEFVVRWALLLVLGGVACLIAFAVVCLYVVRFGVSVSAAGVLEPGSTRRVYSPASGLIGAVRIRPGDSVAQGDVLAILLMLPLRNLAETPHTEPRMTTRMVQTTHGESALPDQRFAYMESELKRVEIRSPSDGTVLTEHMSDLVGRGMSQGGLVCEVATLTDWNVDAFGVNGDLRRVRAGDAAMVGVPAVTPLGALAEETFSGRVVSIHSEPSTSRSDAAARYHLRVRLDSVGIEAGRLRGLRRGMAATLRITTRPARAIDLLIDDLREHTRTRDQVLQPSRIQPSRNLRLSPGQGPFS